MQSDNPIHAILDSLAQQQREGATSLVVTIEPDLIPEAMSTLRDYRKLFAPVILGVTDIAPIYASYERMKQEAEGGVAILILVECGTLDEFRDAIGRMPIRHSSEWRSNGVI